MIFRKNDDRFITDNKIVVNGVTVDILNPDMRRLEYRFVSHVAAFVSDPDDQRLRIGNLIFKRIAVLGKRKFFPVGFGRFGINVIGDPISRNARTAVILNKGNTVFVNSRTGIGQGDGRNILSGILPFDIRMILIQEGRNIGRKIFGSFAVLVFNNQCESITAGFAVFVKHKVRQFARIVNRHFIKPVDNRVVRVGNGENPLRQLSVGAGFGSDTGLVKDIDFYRLLNFIGMRLVIFSRLYQMLQMDRHDLVVGRSIFDIEIRQRQFRFNLGLLEFFVFLLIGGNILCNQFHIIVAGRIETVRRTKSLMRQIVVRILDAVGNNQPVVRIGYIEDFIFIHPVNTVRI